MTRRICAEGKHKGMEEFLGQFRPGNSRECICGRPHEIRTKMVVVRPGAVEEIPCAVGIAAGPGGKPGKIAVTFDEKVKGIVEGKVLPVLKKAGLEYQTVMMQGHGGEIEADLKTAGELMKGIGDEAGMVMCVGSGTMNDLSKYSAAVRGLPYISVATAASMNGYTSSITALTAGEFKTTQETEPAAAVIADVDILKEAPAEMTRAGLGDIVSKWVCNADWKLSHLVRKTYFCDVPFGLIQQQEKYYTTHASELGKGEAGAVQALTEAIMISGFSMSIVGVSSPSSGSEHLISHSWEMKRHLSKTPGKAQLHGAQVGVATVMMARMYELVSELDPKEIDWEESAAKYPTWKEIEKRVKKYFGPVATEVIGETRAKYPEGHELELELEWVAGNWRRMWKELKRFRKSAEDIDRVLEEAGAPRRPGDLGFSKEETREAILIARHMRSRYTILDLAEAMGVLPEFVDRLCEEYC